MDGIAFLSVSKWYKRILFLVATHDYPLLTHVVTPPVQGAPHMATGAAAGETVLVTGASGVIGSCLVRRLLARGYSIHAAVLNPGQCHLS